MKSAATMDEGTTLYWRRNLIVCVFGSFTTLLSLTLLLPFLPVYVQQLGASSTHGIVEWSGICFGATFLGTGITAPLWGHLGDKVGRKKMLVRAALGMAVMTPMLGMAHSVVQLALLRFAMGLIGGYSSAATQFIAAQAPRNRSAWALSVLSTGSLAGNLCGPLVGGILPSFVTIRTIFFLAGLIIAAAAVATIFLIREESLFASSDSQDGVTEVKPLRRFVLCTIFGTAMMVLFANMSIEPIITLFLRGLRGDHAHDVLHSGIVMSVAALGSIVAAPRIGRIADRLGSWKIIERSLLVTALVLIPQAFVQEWRQLLVLRLLMGMSLVGLLPAIAKLLRDTVPGRSLGRMLGLTQSAQYAGQVLGPLAGGFTGAYLGMRSVFIATSAILLFAAWLNRKASALAAE